MIDFNRLRQSMVDSQLRPNDVTDPRILAAMLEIPRERFVPQTRSDLAYLDDDLPVGEAAPGETRYLIEPMVLARLVQALELSGDEHVLDIGCATGYSTALLARLARSVIGLDADTELATKARRTMAELELSNVRVVTGALPEGAPQHGPYDAIFTNGSVELVPDSLLAQLREDGRLVTVVRSGAAGRAVLYLRSSGDVSHRPLFDAAVPMLPGFEAKKGFVF